MDGAAELDALVVGGGPAGLTAALYLARFRRRFLVVDAGAPRAAWIPRSHNIPFFAKGIGGREMLAQMRANLAQYDAPILNGTVTALERRPDHFLVRADTADGSRTLRARRVLLATGAEDVEPDLPGLPDAVRRGLVRYCPICDGFEAAGKRIAVFGHGGHALGEAVFIARTYPSDVTLLTLGQRFVPDDDQRRLLERHDIRLVAQPVAALRVEGGRIGAIRTGDGLEHRFDVLYSALGLHPRAGLALALGARHAPSGALHVDHHNQTSVKGLYAAGGTVFGLDQIVVAMGHAAVAATHIHNRCEIPTEEEPDTSL